MNKKSIKSSRKYTKRTFQRPWTYFYKLAIKYYKCYGSLNIPYSFKSFNGFSYDPEGEELGAWLELQKAEYKQSKLSKEKIELLEDMCIVWDNISWDEYYKLATAYYNHHGNLDIDDNFKTKNGIDYNPKGISLGSWLKCQKKLKEHKELSDNKIKLLENIGIKWVNYGKTFTDYYGLANKYSLYYGSLNMHWSFKTSDGYSYDPSGEILGLWSMYQSIIFPQYKESSIKALLLKEAGLNLDVTEKPFSKQWIFNYHLAYEYYKKNGNLNIEYRFKTKNGIDYDPEGIDLYSWLVSQKYAYSHGRLTSDQIVLLNAIKANFKSSRTLSEDRWMKHYKLVRIYYRKFHTLDIRRDFRTKNGIDYDPEGLAIGQWIKDQKSSYVGRRNYRLSFNQIYLLEMLKYKWFTEEENNSLNSEELKAADMPRKLKELENRLKSLIVKKYSLNELPSKEEINYEFKESFEYTKKK